MHFIDYIFSDQKRKTLLRSIGIFAKNCRSFSRIQYTRGRHFIQAIFLVYLTVLQKKRSRILWDGKITMYEFDRMIKLIRKYWTISEKIIFDGRKHGAQST